MEEKTSLQSVDVPVKVIHRIQSLLPVEEAARTCELSKIWSQAWSTIPALRFPFEEFPFELKDSRKYDKLIFSTLLRYHRNNIPITSFHIKFKFTNKKSASFFDNFIRHVASSKTSSRLKELSINILVGGQSMITLPDEILSIQTLNTLHVTLEPYYNYISSLWSNPVINCVSLCGLELQYVKASDELINNLLSSCRLLEKISLFCCKGLNTIKVKNLPYLRELKFTTIEHVSEILEIDPVPSLRLFHFDAKLYRSCWYNSVPFNTVSLGRSVTQLHIGHVIFDNEIFDLIKSNFPFLESLTLVIWYEGIDNFVITSTSMKSLTIHVLTGWLHMLIRSINVQVYAPNLQYCIYKSTAGSKYPSLSFPNTPPGQIKLIMRNGKL